MLLAEGERAQTLSGRWTTPFPRIDVTTPRKTTNTLKRIDVWLLENARDEAASRKDDFNHLTFDNDIKTKKKNYPKASKDCAHLYLFGTID